MIKTTFIQISSSISYNYSSGPMMAPWSVEPYSAACIQLLVLFLLFSDSASLILLEETDTINLNNFHRTLKFQFYLLHKS